MLKFKRIALIPGDSLYPNHSALSPDRETLFFMAEDSGLCTHYKYHKHKLVLFLSAMRSHAEVIKKLYPLEYIKLEEKNKHKTYIEKLKECVEREDIREIVSYTIEDAFFREEIESFARSRGIGITIVDSPGFINSLKDFRDYLEEVSSPYLHSYYIRQRKKHLILLDNKAKPMHGKWSFDQENRKKLSAAIDIPNAPEPKITNHSKEVIQLVNKFFPHHPGSTNNFHWATTREQAMDQMFFFLHKKFNSFGPYEDAIDASNPFLFHSLLSPYLNLGLITPRELLDNAIPYGLKYQVNYSSLEGFVRQIIGWREFLRGMYHHVNMKKNFFGHERRLTLAWYDGTTGVDPLDNVIRKTTRLAYAHHIERLMIAGNIMLLSEIHPDEVYRWFMELFIDSADWVMTPNVYGMSQFADGGSFATKPYIAGSNYLLKMSNFKKGDWCEVLDGLYWRFIREKKDFLKGNPRMSIMVRSFEKMDPARKKNILGKAEKFIEQFTA